MLDSCPRHPTPEHLSQSSPSQSPAAGLESFWYLNPQLQHCPVDEHKDLSCLRNPSFSAAFPSSAAPLLPQCPPPTFAPSGQPIFSFLPPFPHGNGPQRLFGAAPTPDIPAVWRPASQILKNLPSTLCSRGNSPLLFFLETQKEGEIPFLPVACTLGNMPVDVLLPWVCPK